jgi:RNA polymerase sigma-70 factor, ECF subfamily
MSAAPLTLAELGFSELNGMTPRRVRLLAQAREGNREAFAEMVMPLVPTLYQRARRMTGNVADAEDVRQETLLKAWSRLEQFTGKPAMAGGPVAGDRVEGTDDKVDDFRAWLGRIAGNTSIDVLRQRREGKILSLDEPHGSDEETLGNGIPVREKNPEERYARRELGRMLAGAIRQLPADLRQACLLRDVMQYSSQEVADRLGISVVAVRLRLFRAHRRLRENLEEGARVKARRARMERERAAANRREKFVAISAATEFACGD